MVRTPSKDKSGLRKGTWTLEEDIKLIAYVTRYGCWNWSLLPKFAGLARCGKSCRLRWLNYLRPDLKRGNFTQEEEDAIISLHTKLGNRWSVIASNLPGRTDNEIKNHWHTVLKKRFQEQKAVKKNESKPSKSEDNKSKQEIMDLEQKKSDFEVVLQPATTASTLLYSPLSSSSTNFSSINSDNSAPSSSPSSSSSSNENSVVMEDDHEVAFVDAYKEQPSVIENFRTEPFVSADHVQSPDSVEIPGATSENDFALFDSQIETMIENFWSEPYLWSQSD